MFIPKKMIGAIIGPGGKIIQAMQVETGAIISIEEIGDQGRVEIAANNKAAIDAAVRKIKGIVATRKWRDLRSQSKIHHALWLLCGVLPGKEGLLHISEIDWKRIESMETSGLKENDIIEVKLLDIDARTGKFKLSRKALLPRPPEGEVSHKCSTVALRLCSVTTLLSMFGLSHILQYAPPYLCALHLNTLRHLTVLLNVTFETALPLHLRRNFGV